MLIYIYWSQSIMIHGKEILKDERFSGFEICENGIIPLWSFQANMSKSTSAIMIA